MSNKFYDDGHILVDETRYVVGNKTIPINSITAVEPKEIVYPDKKVGTKTTREGYTISEENGWTLLAAPLIPLIAWLIFVFYFLFDDRGFFGTIIAFVLSVVFAGIGFFVLLFILPDHKASKDVPPVKEDVYESVPSNYYVTLTTASGENDTYQSPDKNKIITIVDAINNAIMARG